jgi:hypothetical protein
MVKTITKVKCPGCGTEISIQDDLARVSTVIREKTQKESFLKLKEKEKVISDLKIQLSEALRRADQSSVQLQGEVQEQAILKILSDLYPHDIITQSKKGANGADLLQVVRLQNGAVCAKISYESKQCKSFSSDWIDKFKQDNLKAGADILILVTSVFPKGFQKFGLIDGVWVCSFDDVKELSFVLRYGLIKLHNLSSLQSGKELKMEELFKYLNSTEFQNTFESIINGFKTIKESHESEKIRTQRFWKERERVMEQVLCSSIDFYTTVRGISGSEIPKVEMLELPKVD